MPYRSDLWMLLACVLCSVVLAQTAYKEGEIQVHDLPSIVAHSHEPHDVLLASLDTLIHDSQVCCGRNAALHDAVEAADPSSLKDLAVKLNGRQLLSDGRPFQIEAEYVTPEAVSAARVVMEIANQRPILMAWNSRFYIVRGVDYVQVEDSTGATGFTIRNFLLWDTRFADERRNLTFHRETEDPAKVQGLLFLRVGPHD